MAKNKSTEKIQTTEDILSAGINALLKKAERDGGSKGLHDAIAGLPKAHQRTILSVPE